MGLGRPVIMAAAYPKPITYDSYLWDTTLGSIEICAIVANLEKNQSRFNVQREYKGKNCGYPELYSLISDIQFTCKIADLLFTAGFSLRK